MTMPAFAMLHGDHEVRADDLGTLVAALIPGYGKLPDSEDGDEAALHARIATLGVVASMHQVCLFQDRLDDEGTVFDGVSDIDSETLLADKLTPAALPDEWVAPVPLTVLTTSTDVIPDGDVYVYDPATERTFLESLAAHGHIQFFVHGG